MRTLKTIGAMREHLRPVRLSGRTIGLVPTMGYLHKGHLELVRRARAENDVVVTSIFVNPLQFSPSEDLERYPRDLERDTEMLIAAGADVLFAPEVSDMYPRPMETVVDVPSLGLELEGSVRPGHFAGVATVVTKLFNIAGPDRAYFGEKDYQQLQVIRRMVEDLAQPVQVIGVPTVREDDGLAFSSRNVYLSDEQRLAARIVPAALDHAERLMANGLTNAFELERNVREFLQREPLGEAEVVAFRDPLTLKAVDDFSGRAALLLLFVRFGQTRLLDNRVITAHLK